MRLTEGSSRKARLVAPWITMPWRIGFTTATVAPVDDAISLRPGLKRFCAVIAAYASALGSVVAAATMGGAGATARGVVGLGSGCLTRSVRTMPAEKNRHTR